MQQRPYKTVSVTVRKRGFFGHVFRVIHWIFQITMVFSMGSYLVFVFDEMSKNKAAAETAGTAIGGFLGIWLIIAVWLVGTIIFGGLSFATRGKLITTTRDVT